MHVLLVPVTYDMQGLLAFHTAFIPLQHACAKMMLHHSYLVQQEASKESHSACKYHYSSQGSYRLNLIGHACSLHLYCTQGTRTSSPNFVGVSNIATVHMQQKIFEGFYGSLCENQMYEISTHIHAHNAMIVCIREIRL